jgi:regulator of replication initiation timing
MDKKTQADRMEEMLIQLIRDVDAMRVDVAAMRQELREFRLEMFQLKREFASKQEQSS